MCLILFAYKCHPRLPLVLAANRDEFYDRPTSPAAFRPDTPDLLAGLDLRFGGTWLGINGKGKIAALANHRNKNNVRKDSLSRGFLVKDFLVNEFSTDDYLEKLEKEANQYNGFSLLFGDMERLCCYSNRGFATAEIPTGFHGQSNDFLDIPWPKVERGKELFERLLSNESVPQEKDLFKMLTDRTTADIKHLPDTGIGIEKESDLSPIFVRDLNFGTRSSTLVFIDSDDNVTFVERTYVFNTDSFMTVKYKFKISR